jgi:peptidoglycan-associated lipoprotein
MQTLKQVTSSAFLFLSLVVMGVGCKPDYPSCDTNQDCKEKEYCVARKCQQCRDSNDCGPGKSCTNGACKAIPGYCTSRAQCGLGQDCIANRCRSCIADDECPSGTLCLNGLCEKAQCRRDEECAQDQECQKGRCISIVKKVDTGIPCPLETVYFGFDVSTLTSEATATLTRNITCLKKSDRSVDIIGRADPRGTTEYNMALSDRRAQAVRDYLKLAGMDAQRLRPVPRGAMDAVGTDESGWARDRRVDSEWK